jgi:hypothetical protein
MFALQPVPISLDMTNLTADVQWTLSTLVFAPSRGYVIKGTGVISRLTQEESCVCMSVKPLIAQFGLHVYMFGLGLISLIP